VRGRCGGVGVAETVVGVGGGDMEECQALLLNLFSADSVFIFMAVTP
ncbi:hypothetical protein A2U01_0068399, partial [Trifolium medium]|nr:hypothetical protein [Trifolium medium]